ncbi:hypothetical protein JCM19238_3809 [Vibrio ponticus]|nr:hypothetical protein JCM19238_3809 [Vibrio ponticus]
MTGDGSCQYLVLAMYIALNYVAIAPTVTNHLSGVEKF